MRPGCGIVVLANLRANESTCLAKVAKMANTFSRSVYSEFRAGKVKKL